MAIFSASNDSNEAEVAVLSWQNSLSAEALLFPNQQGHATFSTRSAWVSSRHGTSQRLENLRFLDIPGTGYLIALSGHKSVQKPVHLSMSS
jgi:hypothetical protein